MDKEDIIYAKKILKKATIFIVTVGISWWLFSPMLDVFFQMLFTPPKEFGRQLSDHYYTRIGGITYVNNKFYILTGKPYLFNPIYGYIYSSNNLSNWENEISRKDLPAFIYSYMNPESYYITDDGYTFIDNEHLTNISYNTTNDLLPRKVKNDCYIVANYNGFISKNCNSKWEKVELFHDKDALKNIIVKDLKESSLLVDDKMCIFLNKNPINNVLSDIYCSNKLAQQNITAFHVIHKIIQANKLNIIIDGSHTTYGDGKYVGVFYKDKKWWFIISTDGVHYEIKAVPTKVTSSLATILFN